MKLMEDFRPQPAACRMSELTLRGYLLNGQATYDQVPDRVLKGEVPPFMGIKVEIDNEMPLGMYEYTFAPASPANGNGRSQEGKL